jgi:hypothetical protein
MASTLQIFDSSTLLRIRSLLLQDDFEESLHGNPEGIANRVGGRMIDSGIEFDDSVRLELPPVGSSDFDSTDMVNTEIIFEALPGLNPFNASRDEIWATLCFGAFRQYVQRRWRPKSQQSIDLRRNYQLHYLSSGIRDRWRENAVSRLWWLRHYAQSVQPDNPQRVLSLLFFRDKNLGEAMLTKPAISTVPPVARAIFREAYMAFIHPGGKQYSRAAFRGFIKDVDVDTGRTLLPIMDDDTAQALVREVFHRHFAQ